MKRPTIQICPSVLAADFANLGREVKRAEDAGADALHVDIMDGHFVPNLSIGPSVVAAINRFTDLPLHVHLMMYNPFDYVERFVEAGADQISFHIEATEDIEETLAFIERCNVRPALAINPETPVSMLLPFLALIDEVLIMSVHPGFGGQAFIPESIERIREMRSFLDAYEPETEQSPISIAVDGGINEKTAKECSQAGANVFVVGTHLFGQLDMQGAIKKMRSLLADTEVN